MCDQDLLISVDQLAELVDDPDLRVLDCRFNLFAPDAGRAEYSSAHIPGAVYADLNDDLAAPVSAKSGRHPLPATDTVAETFGRMGIGANTRVVVYDDRSGAVAARAWWLLRWLGHANVVLLDGGLDTWITRALPLEEDIVPVAPQAFTPSPQDGLTIETDDILAAIQAGMLLVDARAANRFRGLQEPIDKVAGHIPGATNLPFERSLRADGRWKPAEELRQIWADVVKDGPEEPWSAMCGSGVTACHLAVSAKLAGFPDPRLYVGSWSEWIRDSSRPVASEKS